jgi:hypothetical protein
MRAETPMGSRCVSSHQDRTLGWMQLDSTSRRTSVNSVGSRCETGAGAPCLTPHAVHMTREVAVQEFRAVGPRQASFGMVLCPDLRVDLYLVDQPSKRHRRDYAQYRESEPEGDVVPPLRITVAKELWAGTLDHSGRIGNLSVKLYAAPHWPSRAVRASPRQVRRTAAGQGEHHHSPGIHIRRRRRRSRRRHSLAR